MEIEYQTFGRKDNDINFEFELRSTKVVFEGEKNEIGI